MSANSVSLRPPLTRDAAGTLLARRYAILGLVIFADLTAFDFQRLRRRQDIRTAPLLVASIFLDILNAFLLLLPFFGREDRRRSYAGSCDHPSRCPGRLTPGHSTGATRHG